MSDQPPDPEQQARLARRAAARQARARTRRRAGLAVLVAAAVAIAAALIAAGSGGGRRAPGTAAAAGKAARPARRHPPRVVSGGPLSPVRAGGISALWAARNVVAPQPRTGADYAAASKLRGLPGYLLIADRGNNRILVVNARRHRVFEYPTRHDLALGRRLFFNDDTFVEPGGRALIANEEDNHAIVDVGIQDHRLHLLFGQPGVMGTDSTHLHTPDDAYKLPDGSITVADAYNCRILFIRAHRIVREIGDSSTCRHDPPRYLGAVNGDTPEPDGGVLISEIPGGWIDEVSASGRLRFAFQAPVSYPSDPQPLPGGRILLADYASPGHILILSHHGHVFWRYGPRSGYGRLDHPSLAMALPNGDIAVNDDYRERVVIIDPRTNRIVWQYGHTDKGGTAPGYLNTPDGMDFIPAGPHGGPDWAAVVHP
ncbi:MAG TPA: hypothetical protein VFT42_09570 [Solirubrobacteraceae bacterium]|nr:hypothetical protein [Solirubrobacteraceae bacterium]